MNLITEFFVTPNHQRNSEILYCLHQNLRNELIRKVFLFVSDPTANLHFESSKIEFVEVERRPTYRDFFEFANANLKDQICIVSNSDVFFDESLENISDEKLVDKVIALSRWELFKGDLEDEWRISLIDNAASQDSWIFKTPIRTCEEMNFTLGVLGCDNRISKLIFDQGYQVINPAKLIVSVHLHQSRFSTYPTHSRVPGPYLLVATSDDQDAEPVYFEADAFDDQGRPVIVGD